MIMDIVIEKGYRYESPRLYLEGENQDQTFVVKMGIEGTEVDYTFPVQKTEDYLRIVIEDTSELYADYYELVAVESNLRLLSGSVTINDRGFE